MLEWFNHDCPYTKKHYQGNTQAMQREYTKRGVVWLSVVSSAPSNGPLTLRLTGPEGTSAFLDAEMGLAR